MLYGLSATISLVTGPDIPYRGPFPVLTAKGMRGNMKSRLRFVDIAKGLGMICIILGHLGRPEINHVVFTFHVPLFFLIAGYFHRPAKLGIEGMRKRAGRLVVPYIYCAIACSLGKGVVACLRGSVQGSWSVVAVSFVRALYGSGTPSSPFLGIKSFGAIWFLLALFWALCIYDVLCNQKYATLVVVGCFAVGFVTKVFWLPFSFQAGLCGLLFVHIGAQFRRVTDTFKEHASPRIVASALVLCLIVWTIVFFVDRGHLYLVKNHFENIPLDVIGAIAGSVLLVSLSFCIDKIPVISSALGTFGKYSLTALCFHMFDLAVIPWTDLLKSMGLSVSATGSWKTCLVLAVMKLAWASFGVCVAAMLRHLRDVSATEGHNLLNLPDLSGRIRSIDIGKGVAILLVVAAHQCSVDPTFRKLAFSLHMPFFFLANAFFVSRNYDVTRTFCRSCKSLLVPYITAGLLSVFLRALVTPDQTKAAVLGRLVSIIGGMSKTGAVFQQLESTWLVWFVACLFIARNVYVLMRSLTKRWHPLAQFAISAVLCAIGWTLGKMRLFLPWSIDVALFSQVFMFLGDEARRRGVLRETPPIQALVLLSGLWVALALGGYQIEMATRAYPGFIFCIAGACLGSYIVLVSSRTIDSSVHEFGQMIACFLAWAGRNSIVILVVHCLRMMWAAWTGGEAFIASFPWWVNAVFEIAFCVAVTFCFDRVRNDIAGVAMSNLRFAGHIGKRARSIDLVKENRPCLASSCLWNGRASFPFLIYVARFSK